MEEIQQPGAKRTRLGDDKMVSAISTSTKAIESLLAQQSQQCSVVEALKQSNDQNKYLMEMLAKQSKEKDKLEEEDYSREAALVFAFEGKFEDDAETKICHEVRTGIRPCRGDWIARWKSLGRHAKPKCEGLGMSHLGTIALSPVVIKKMHDRGMDLKLAMFFHKNQDIAVRSGKWRKIGDGREAMHESFDWKEPDSTQAVAEAVLNYTIALWRIWPEDWSGMVLLKILVRFKYLANAKTSKKGQLNLLSMFVDAFFGRCAAAGREHKPPPTWREGEALMLEHLHSNNQDVASVRAGKDPYQVKSDKEQCHCQAATVTSREVKAKNQNTRGNTGTRDIFNMPLGMLNLKEKRALACKDWNDGGCADQSCKFRHRCSKVDKDRVCFGDHTLANHR